MPEFEKITIDELTEITLANFKKYISIDHRMTMPNPKFKLGDKVRFTANAISTSFLYKINAGKEFVINGVYPTSSELTNTYSLIDETDFVIPFVRETLFSAGDVLELVNSIAAPTPIFKVENPSSIEELQTLLDKCTECYIKYFGRIYIYNNKLSSAEVYTNYATLYNILTSEHKKQILKLVEEGKLKVVGF